MSAKTAVVLPGTGSDDVFVRTAFAAAAAGAGLGLHAPRPRWGHGLIEGYLGALDAAAEEVPIVAGGVSLGAHVAATWALANPDRCAGLLLALPAWSGAAADAPAARLARASAGLVSAHGTEAAIAIATAGVADWLAAELARAWRRYGSGLAASLTVAATAPAPLLAELPALDIPAGVSCCTDDPVHPAAVAERWAAALPRAALRRTSLTAVGIDPAALGRATVDAYRQAALRSQQQ